MVFPKEKMRELVFQILYSQDFYEAISENSIPFFMHEVKASKKNVCIAMSKSEEIIQKISDIDPIIQEKVKEYSLTRISRIEKNILRLALYELLYDKNLPSSIVIAEGIRLCKKFATPESGKFVHAVIDEVYQSQKLHA